MSRLKQRETNRLAISAAAALLEAMDFTEIFADLGEDESDPNTMEHNDEVMDKAQANAVRRIRGLIGETK